VQSSAVQCSAVCDLVCTRQQQQQQLLVVVVVGKQSKLFCVSVARESCCNRVRVEKKKERDRHRERERERERERLIWRRIKRMLNSTVTCLWISTMETEEEFVTEEEM
jgi:hypothetical protein